jgi:hypothetical protein
VFWVCHRVFGRWVPVFGRNLLNMSIILASFAENARIDEQLAKAPEGVYISCSRNNTSLHRYFAPLWIKNTKLLHNFMFSIGTTCKNTMLYCEWLGEGGIVATIQRVLCQVNSFVEMFTRTSELIRNQEVLTSAWRFTEPRESICNTKSPNVLRGSHHFTWR